MYDSRWRRKRKDVMGGRRREFKRIVQRRGRLQSMYSVVRTGGGGVIAGAQVRRLKNETKQDATLTTLRP